MTTFDAGKARATYELDLGPLRKQIDDAKRALQGLDAARKAAQSAQAAAAATPAQRAGPDPAVALQRQEAAALRLARANATLAQSQGDNARASRILTDALQGVNRTSIAAIQTQTQLERVNARLASSASNAAGKLQVLPRTIAGLSNEAATFAKTFAAGFGASTLLTAALGARQLADDVGDARDALRTAAGSTELYQKALREARISQETFGGTLQGNTNALQAFVTASKNTGTELDDLVLLSRQLVLLDPTAGIEKANEAVRDLAFGRDRAIRSFDLSKEALAALNNESLSTADRFRILTEELTKAGFSADAVAQRAETGDQAFRRWGRATEELTVEVGILVSELGKPIWNLFADTADDITRALTANRTIEGFQAQIVATSQSFEEYTAAAQGVNAQLSEAGRRLPVLSEAQFLYTKALEANGVATAEAAGKARAQGEALSRISGFTNEARNANSAFYQTYQGVPELIAEVIAADESQIRVIDDLVRQRNLGIVSVEGFIGELQTLQAVTRENTKAQEEANAAVAAAVPLLNTQELATKAVDSALQAATKAAFESANASGTLRDQASAAADALLAAGAAGETAAAQLAASAADVDVLTVALFNQRREAAALAAQRAGERAETPEQAAAAQAARDAAAALKFQAEVQREITRATGDTAQRLALVNAELAKAVPQSEEQKRLLVEQARLQKQLADEAARGGTARATRTPTDRSAADRQRLIEQAQREQERRIEQVVRANERIEAETKSHYERLTRSAEDYALSQGRAEEDYERQRRRLLAEGRIFEASQLEEQRAIERRRAEEDQRRAQQREVERSAQAIAAIREALAKELGGTAVPTVPTVAAGAADAAVLAQQAQQVAALPGVAGAGASLRITFAPIQLTLDGAVVAEAVYPDIEERLDLALAGGVITVGAVAPPATSGAVGGPRA